VAERTLSRRDLNRALLVRQLLLERARTSLPRALERMAGLQAQYAPAMYLGMWSRLEGLAREAVTRALERRTVVQGTLMRSTIHLVSARDYWPFAIATRKARRESWLRYHEGTPRGMAAAARRLRAQMGEGPMRRAEIEELLGRPAALGVGLWLDMVRVPPSGTWERRRGDLYGAAEDWLGPPAIEPDEAIAHLVRSYLRGFGPAAKTEIANWAGLPLGAVTRALASLELRRFCAEDGAELVDLPRLPLPDPDTPAPVRFLPVWDATLLVHARRAQILPEEHRSKVFHVRTPHSVNTFLVDGAVAGTWRHERGRIELSPFERLDRATRRELDEEAERLAAFHA
jgi:hypothetical protein